MNVSLIFNKNIVNGTFIVRKGTTDVDCRGCSLLKEIPNIIGLEFLNCNYCPNLKEISYIKGLKYLHCSDCPLLKEIPNIIDLQRLCISDCPSLTEIPDIIGLEELYCNKCSSLTEIPIIKNLKQLCCDNSPIFNKKNIYGTDSYHRWLNKVIFFIYILKYNRLSDGILRELMTKL